jgi:hypothetical protein
MIAATCRIPSIQVIPLQIAVAHSQPIAPEAEALVADGLASSALPPGVVMAVLRETQRRSL